jgi:sporulation protein YlmC with PRC-barrel domain
MNKTLLLAALGVAGSLAIVSAADAQVAGSTTTVGVTVTEASQLALGWSVKKGILGKTVYNDAGEKVGNVEDLIIDLERNVSYVIVGAGGFIGMGRHDVAVPITQIRDQAGKIVMPGATKDALKAMPAFDYANDTARRDQFVAKAEQDIAKAKGEIAVLEKKAASAAGDVKTKLDQQIAALRLDLKNAQDKLAAMNHAAANRWKEFESDVTAAVARLKKSVEKTTG